MIAPRVEVAATPLAVHGGHHGVGNEVRHDFSSCINAFGPADVVRRAVRNAAIDEYPDPESRAARAAAAERWNVPPDQIAFGAGAAELIHAVCAAYLNRGDVAAIVAPAFGEYERAVRLRGARPHVVWCFGGREELAAIPPEIQRVRPRLVFVCAPMTPIGAAIALADIRAIANACESVGSLLVLDQSYDAFAEQPLGTPALRGHAAVLHIRSLTKEYALAGVRLGFAIGPVPVIDALNRVRVPWAASSAAQAAAVAAMTGEAHGDVVTAVFALRAEAIRLREACSRLGFATSPSTTHYFVVSVRDAAAVRRILLDRRGICVRDCTSFGLPEHIRVAARTRSENDALLLALGMTELDEYRAIAGRPHFTESHANG